MAAPLYFFPRKQMSDVVDERADRFRATLLREYGLEDTFSDVASVRAQTARSELTAKGPGGSSGVLVTVLPASGECPLRTGYFPDFQTWRQTAKDPELWIGVDNEHPPKPEDLLRASATRLVGAMKPPHPGYSVTLAGGRWVVPIVRRPDFVAGPGRVLTALPMDLEWDLDGNFVERIKPEYQALWEETADICELFYDRDGTRREGAFEISIELGLKWCLRILGLNYRLGRHEQKLLHVIDKNTVWLVLGMAIDAPLVNEVLSQKKTSPPVTVSTSLGSMDESAAIGPAVASSY